MSSKAQSSKKVQKTVEPSETPSVDGDVKSPSKPAFKRILQRAGVKRMSKDIYLKLQKCMNLYMDDLFRDIVVFVENDGRKTVNVEDLEGALSLRNQYIAAGLNPNAKKTKNLQSCNSCGKSGPVKKSKKVGDTPTKPHRFRPGTRAARFIRFQQKHSDCFAIPMAVFAKISREICGKYMQKPRFAVEVIELIQLTVENYILQLCIQAYSCSQHAGRDTIQPKDIELVQNILDV